MTTKPTDATPIPSVRIREIAELAPKELMPIASERLTLGILAYLDGQHAAGQGELASLKERYAAMPNAQWFREAYEGKPFTEVSDAVPEREPLCEKWCGKCRDTFWMYTGEEECPTCAAASRVEGEATAPPDAKSVRVPARGEKVRITAVHPLDCNRLNVGDVVTVSGASRSSFGPPWLVLNGGHYAAETVGDDCTEGAAEAKPDVTYDRRGRGMNRKEAGFPHPKPEDIGLAAAPVAEPPSLVAARADLRQDRIHVDLSGMRVRCEPERCHKYQSALIAERDTLKSQLTAAQSALGQANANKNRVIGELEGVREGIAFRDAEHARLLEQANARVLELETRWATHEEICSSNLDNETPAGELDRLNPYKRQWKDQPLPTEPLPLFLHGIRYYAGMLEDDDNWSHGLGHIESLCVEFDKAIHERAGKAYVSPREALDAAHERITELEQRLARVAELAHDRNGDTLEWRSKRLGKCASVSWDHIEEALSTDPLKRRSTLKWAKLAAQLTASEERAEQANARVVEVEKERARWENHFDRRTQQWQNDSDGLESALAEANARAEKLAPLAPLQWTSNGQAGDGQNVCGHCDECTDEPHELTECIGNLRKDRDALHGEIGRLQFPDAAPVAALPSLLPDVEETDEPAHKISAEHYAAIARDDFSEAYVAGLEKERDAALSQVEALTKELAGVRESLYDQRTTLMAANKRADRLQDALAASNERAGRLEAERPHLLEAARLLRFTLQMCGTRLSSTEHEEELAIWQAKAYAQSPKQAATVATALPAWANGKPPAWDERGVCSCCDWHLGEPMPDCPNCKGERRKAVATEEPNAVPSHRSPRGVGSGAGGDRPGPSSGGEVATERAVAAMWFYAESQDAENWQGPHGSLEDALEEGRADYAGRHDSLWVDEAHPVDWDKVLRGFVDADDLLERFGEYAGDNEHIEDPEPEFKTSKMLAQGALEAWAVEHLSMRDYWQCIGKATVYPVSPPPTPALTSSPVVPDGSTGESGT